MSEAKVENMETTSKKPATSTDLAKMPKMSIQVKNIDLDMEEIRKWIAPEGATPKEIYTFGRICQTLGLSPFKKQIYFIKYGNQDASIVVGYTTYIDRAERSGQLDGWHVELDDKENPTEATITIYRKDWSHPFEWTVYLADVIKLKRDNTPQSTWATQLRFQLRKCTISQGFRLAFPSECGDLPYTAEEIGEFDSYLPDVPEMPEITEAEVMGAEVVDTDADRDYLRGQYFKLANQYFGGENSRHKWQEEAHKGGVITSASASTMTAGDFNQAINLLEGYMQEIQDATTPDEDAPGATPATEGEPEVEMETADAVQANLDAELLAKQQRIAELIADSPIKSIDTPGFTTWWNHQIPDEAGRHFTELDAVSLDALIVAAEVREDTGADDAAEANGDIPH